MKASKASLVLTVIGTDRPGIVESLAATVARHGGNWEESRMAHLGGRFAGILHVSVDSERIDALRTALEALDAKGLRIVSEAASREVSVPKLAFRLEVIGNDREGIVRDVSRALAASGVNVEQLETSCESAAMSGSPLFRAEARLRVPETTDLESLRATLEGIGDDLMVDITLAPTSDEPPVWPAGSPDPKR